MKIARAAVPFVALTLAACVVEPDPAPATGTTTQAIIYDPDSDGCPKWGCGTNSPVMDIFDFHDLDESGQQANLAGVKVKYLLQNGVAYKPDVVVDRLVARSYSNPSAIALSGAQLTGARLYVDTPKGVFAIHIVNVHHDTPFWVGPAGTVETYELAYTGPGYATAMRLCSNPPSAYSRHGEDWPAPMEAILFTGDRYDADALTVTASDYAGAGTWFNIGCAGSVLAKLHLTRHTTASQVSGYTSARSERQAMLKMYASDVCGDGTPFTKQGTPLWWENSKGWDTLGSIQSHEALWSSTGAMCMDVHRLQAQYGWDIAASCAPRPCSGWFGLPGFPDVWPRGAYVLTGNPP